LIFFLIGSIIDALKIRRQEVAVEKINEKYRCNVCGNEVIVTKVGGGELVCCKKPMEKIEG
jgi:desulfoferrodoxin-like iron-binding protein